MEESRQNTELILALLKADLINNRLICGLQNAGLIAGDFYLDLSLTVFQLMGFTDRDEELNKLYIHTLDRLVQAEPGNFHSQKNSLAIELYAELLAEKKFREKLRMKE